MWIEDEKEKLRAQRNAFSGSSLLIFIDCWPFLFLFQLMANNPKMKIKNKRRLSGQGIQVQQIFSFHFLYAIMSVSVLVSILRWRAKAQTSTSSTLNRILLEMKSYFLLIFSFYCWPLIFFRKMPTIIKRKM